MIYIEPRKSLSAMEPSWQGPLVTFNDLQQVQSEGHYSPAWKFDFPEIKEKNKCDSSFWCDFDSLKIHLLYLNWILILSLL